MNRELHRAGNRSCMHIELDITGSKIKYVGESIYVDVFRQVDYLAPAALGLPSEVVRMSVQNWTDNF